MQRIVQVVNAFYYIRQNGTSKVTKCTLEFKSSYASHICQNTEHIQRHLQMSRRKLWKIVCLIRRESFTSTMQTRRKL